MPYADVMDDEQITVRFAIEAPTMNRHRVSVWNDDGSLLCPASADVPTDLSVEDGATIWVEASVPAKPTRLRPEGRAEGRWALRAASDAHAVLKLGQKGAYGASRAIEIRVDGAAPHRGRRSGA